MENASAQMSQYQIQADPDEVDLQLAQELIHWILTHRAGEMQAARGGRGAVLVFLPAGTKYRSSAITWRRIPDSARHHLVLPLHSMVPPKDQKGVFQRPRSGVIRLSSRAAEAPR